MLTRWDKIRAVERMQDYIEANLTRPVTMAGLADAARYSQWHAARMFREVTGTAPFEYLRRRRLTAAATRLCGSSCRVIDVAFDFMFDSHEGFTRAFAREFRLSPSRFRKCGSDAELFMPPRLRDWYSRRQKGESTMEQNSKPQTVFVQVMERPARKIILKRGTAATHYFEYCEEVGCEVWDVLTALKETLQEPMGLWLPETMIPPGTSRYVQGVEVAAEYAGQVPDGFELVDLPPCKMMVFQGPSFKDAEFEQAIESLWDVMNSYQPELYGYCWADDDAPRFQLCPDGYRGYIEGRPVRPVSA